jgi:hypothetical protein
MFALKKGAQYPRSAAGGMEGKRLYERDHARAFQQVSEQEVKLSHVLI